MRLVVLGASGLVGSAVCRQAAAQGLHPLFVVRRFPTLVAGATEQFSLDLRERGEVDQLLKTLRPEIVINAAAISEPGDCVADPDGSAQLNVLLPRWIAEATHRHPFRFLHLSSEQVFAGDRAPYAVEAPVSPRNLYGRQKAESEAAVMASARSGTAAVIRLPLLLGNSATGRRSVHERLLADWASGRTPRLFTDEIRQVAHADNVAAMLLELAGRSDLFGLLHWAGADPISRFVLGERIRQQFGLSPEQAPLVATTRVEAGVADQRPADLRLDLAPLHREMATAPQTLGEQLSRLTVPSFLRAPLNVS